MISAAAVSHLRLGVILSAIFGVRTPDSKPTPYRVTWFCGSLSDPFFEVLLVIFEQ